MYLTNMFVTLLMPSHTQLTTALICQRNKLHMARTNLELAIDSTILHLASLALTFIQIISDYS